MARLKTFGLYLLLLVVFYIFSSFIAYEYIVSTYNEIQGNIIKTVDLDIKIDVAKATLVNGYVTGTVTNTSNSDIQSKYIKIDFISKKGNIILTKYLQIDNIKEGETKNFKASFRAENIEKYSIQISDTAETENSGNVISRIIGIDDIDSDESSKLAVFAATFILLHYFI